MEIKMSKHDCKAEFNYLEYGTAITQCFEREDGRFFAGNDEYTSEVDYCPMCGKKAKTPTKRKGINETFK